jgi:N4-gp56 family major capsid protein
MALPTAASVLISGLSASPTIFYDRTAIDTLYSNLFMYQACELKIMPDHSGTTMQLQDYTAMTANTTPATEGTPGAGQTLTNNPRNLSLDQYVDYVTFSDKVVLTGFQEVVDKGAELLGERGALSVDTVISTAVDTVANSDSATRLDINDGSYMTAAQSRNAAWTLRSKNIKPKANGNFFGIIHSLSAFDLVNDTTAGGFTDLQKYSDTLAKSNPALVGITGARIGVVGGVEWFESNAVPTETNWQSSTHNAYHAYVFGKDAFFASSLGKTKLGQRNFTVKVSNFDGGNALDPANVIKSAASYNFFFGVVKRPGSVNGFRRIRCESSIG